MDKYQKIIEASFKVDERWINVKSPNITEICYPVPDNHYRYKKFKNYCLTIQPISQFHFVDSDFVLIDSAIASRIKIKNPKIKIEIIIPSEQDIKTESILSARVAKWKKSQPQRIIGIGGGIISNIASYLAEQLDVDLILMPTTIVAMSDGAIGGKVRINKIENEKFIKHAYKSFYEPSEIILDPGFLGFLSEQQVRYGLAEIIKHALYQSDNLANYILSNNFQPFSDKISLLRAILWTADLKRICLEEDPEESKDGSYLILRAAHDISDKLEEESKLTLPHTNAVLLAMKKDLESNPVKLELLEKIYNKLDINL